MKNVAEFKRRLKVGTKVKTIYHQEFAGRDEKGNYLIKDKDLGVREISIVQSNSFALKTKKKDGTETDSWCNYPKATEAKFPDENTVVIYTEDFRQKDETVLIPCLTYQFI